MALIRRNSKVEDKIPTSSMADIAFLLLVFFLTTTTFDEEKGLQVVLPEEGPESEQEVSPKNLLFLLVQADGSVVVRRGESPAEQRITARQVEGVMRQALANNPNIIGVVQTSPEATYENMI
ncbi:MAG TPA: biopolymer transporter ExbD, partial [Longimicrobiaceae bacterium]|nr:biopolymer transporter ExbD [Longimicrobiaceae bacterium]